VTINLDKGESCTYVLEWLKKTMILSKAAVYVFIVIVFSPGKFHIL
jgi:hypothetical protein